MGAGVSSSRTEPVASVESPEEASARWVLACLMADMPADPGTVADLSQPWKAIVESVAPRPLDERLVTLGDALVREFGSRSDDLLNRIFETDPRVPCTEARTPNPFPFPPLYRGKRETESPSQHLNVLAPTSSGTAIPFQGGPHAETDSPALLTATLGDFLETVDTDQEWCVEKLFPMEGASIVASPGGWGKSWMLLDLAIETARGGLWLVRFRTQKLRVLYVDEESSPRLLRRRLRKLLTAKQLRATDLDIHFAVGQGFSLSSPTAVARLRRLLEALRPGLIIFDSLIRIHEAEENSASEMSKVFAILKSLIQESKASFVIADHQRKPGHIAGSLDTLLRGSSEKKAFVDCLLSMQKKRGALIVEHSKSRHDVELPAFVVQIEDVGVGATVVRCIGDAEGLQAAAKHDEAKEFIQSAIPTDGEWVARKQLVSLAKAHQVSTRVLDDTLKALVEAGTLERDDRKAGKGRGGNPAHFRRKGPAIPFHVAEWPETDSDRGMLL